MEHAEVPGMIREQRLSRWIEEYSDPVLRTCFVYLSDRAQAEDATTTGARRGSGMWTGAKPWTNCRRS